MVRMKPEGRHPDKRLSGVNVGRLKKGRHADGNGLYLVVDPSGARRWVLRTVVHGRRRDIGLGSASLVPLKDARDLAAKFRRVARDGGDPLAERNRERRVVPTFAEAARTVHAERIAKTSRNAKHMQGWLASLEMHAFPTIGDKQVQHVDQPDVLRVLSPIWNDKPETARRVLQRISTILEWATVAGHRVGANPADGVRSALQKHRDRPEHHRALPYAELPALWPRLVAMEGTGAMALRFAILTAARSGEVRMARGAELDVEARTWTIPAARMKAGREHRVPLSDEALTILTAAKPLSSGPDGLVFPSRIAERALSNMTLAAVLKRLEVPAVPHGFRSTFRDWAEDATNDPHEVKEAALAHTVENKAERAYRRSDLFAKRREMMETWGAFVTGIGAKVVRLAV